MVSVDRDESWPSMLRFRVEDGGIGISMPVMNGLEAVAALRAQEDATGPHQPVIALTAQAMSEDHERFLVSGFDGFLNKPIRLEMLADALERLADRELPSPAGAGAELACPR